MPGLIALDIDGTVTAEHHAIPSEVVLFLKQLKEAGWSLIFITGRTFQWAFRSLQTISFPYHLAVNNGALLLEMPSKRILKRKYISKDLLPRLEPLCREEGTDFMLYAGYEANDQVYYRPQFLTPPLSTYLEERCLSLEEPWTPVESYAILPLSEFAAAKCFAPGQSAERLSHQIETRLGLHAPAIRDPFKNETSAIFVVQVTHPQVSKGETVKDFRALVAPEGLIIVAGDDKNDRSMLAQADIKIVMATAPPEMLQEADLVAPPATELGIITGLKEALKHASNHRF